MLFVVLFVERNENGQNKEFDYIGVSSWSLEGGSSVIIDF